MTEPEVASVQAALGGTLPGHYRGFLLSYPQPLRDTRLDLGRIRKPRPTANCPTTRPGSSN